MLGFGDIGVSLAFLMTLGITVICVVYGLVNWNRPSVEVEKLEVQEELDWEAREEAAPGKAGKEAVK